MKILHLETSSKNCSVAISDGKELLCLCEEAAQDYKQSERLHTFIEWALEGAEITLKDLDAVCLGMGPGSYTGLRIGAASAKGFCFGLNLPLIAIHSMDTMVEPFIHQGFDEIVPLIDARRMEVYTAEFHGETGGKLTEIQPKILDENSFQHLKDKKVIFAGDGAEKAQEILNLPNAEFQPKIYPSAAFLIEKAVEKFHQKEFEDIAYFEPFYLKAFQGVKRKR